MSATGKSGFFEGYEPTDCDSFYLRRAREEDLEAVLAIVESGRNSLAADGVDQWQNGKPSNEDFARDIRSQRLWVFEDAAGTIAAVAALVAGEDPNYTLLLAGAWIPAPSQMTLQTYITVHRFVVAPTYRGAAVSKRFFQALFLEAQRQGFNEMRVDTHPNNHRMRRLVEGLGFACAGVVCIDGDRSDKRLVYQLYFEQEISGKYRRLFRGLAADSADALETLLPRFPHYLDNPEVPILRHHLVVSMSDGALVDAWIYGPRVPVLVGPYGIDCASIPLLVLHGNGEDHRSLAAQIAHQAAVRSVVAIDCRAQGVSTRGRAPLTYELLAQDAFEVLNAIGISRAHVLGFSDGGIEALLMARDAPRHIVSLTAVGANCAPSGLDKRFLEHERIRSIALAFGRVVSRKMERACELSRLMLHEPHIAGSSLSRIACPSTLVAGEHDLVLPEETRRIAQAIPQAQMVIIPSCGHMVPLEASDELNCALDQTIARVEHSSDDVVCDGQHAPQAVLLASPRQPYLPDNVVALPLEFSKLKQVLALYEALLAHEKAHQDASRENTSFDAEHPRSSGDSCGWIEGCWPLPGDVEERLAAGQYRGLFAAEDIGSDGKPFASAQLLGVQALDHDMGYGFAGEDQDRGGAAPCWEKLPDQAILVAHLLAVNPAAGRKGIGRALVADLISQARIRGAKAIRLNTSPENVAATCLYHSCGFQTLAPVWLPYEGLPLTGWTVPFEMRLD